MGYILYCTTCLGALFKGSWQVGAIATTCLRVSTTLSFTSIPLLFPLYQKGDKYRYRRTRCEVVTSPPLRGDKVWGVPPLPPFLKGGGAADLPRRWVFALLNRRSLFFLLTPSYSPPLSKGGQGVGVVASPALRETTFRNLASLAKGRTGGRIL